jgi:hypothetical protein
MTLLLHYWLESSGDPLFLRTLSLCCYSSQLASVDVRVGNQQTDCVFEYLDFECNVNYSVDVNKYINNVNDRPSKTMPMAGPM